MTDGSRPTDARSPAHWGQAEKRAEVLKRYLSLDNPSVADADKAAAEIGVKRRMFYILLSAVHSSSQKAQRTSQPARIRIAPEVDELIRDTLADADLDAPMNSIARGIRAEAIRRGLHPPQNKTVQTRLISARVAQRQQMKPTKAVPEFAIDHSGLLLNVNDGTRTGAAQATTMIDLTSGRILGLHLGLDAPDPRNAAAALSHSIEAMGRIIDEATPGRSFATMRMITDGSPAWAELHGILTQARISTVARVSKSPRSGTWLSRMVGRHLLGVPLRPRMDPGDLNRRVASMTPIPLDQLHVLMSSRLAEILPAYTPRASDWAIAAVRLREELTIFQERS